MKIRIQLTSDMCLASGDGYNSVVDTEVVHDEYGLPSIPAKRLKGCLREVAQELVDWQQLDEGVLLQLFGQEGDRKAKLVLSDARLEGYDSYVEEIKRARNNGKNVVHAQNVLRQFTYIRTQTAIDTETGIADEGSLRNMRVVKKGLVFEAQAEVPKQLQKEFAQICRQLRHMGVARTRGLGEVTVTVEAEKDASTETAFAQAMAQVKRTKAEEIRISYWMQLKSPVLLKSVAGGETRTQDYLEGNKMLGILAEALGQEAFRSEILESGVICSNAYLSDLMERMVPASAAYYVNKDQKVQDNVLVVKNRAAQCEDSRRDTAQITPLANCFVGQARDGVRRMVRTSSEIHYHHARPGDKSIGRATRDTAFYQLSSLSAGQVFAGYIQCKSSLGEVIVGALEKMKNTRIGNNRSSEYGAINIVKVEVAPMEKVSCKDEVFCMRMVAPTIIYNDMGMCTTSVSDVEKTVGELVGAEVKVEATFLKYATLGGYNTTWQRPKPVLNVLDKGTTYVFRVISGEATIPMGESIFVGERNHEGYGEIIFEKVSNEYCEKMLTITSEVSKAPVKITTNLVEELEMQEACDIAMSIGRESAKSVLKGEGEEKALTAISRVFLVFYEKSSIREGRGVLDPNAMLKEIESWTESTKKKSEKKDCAESLVEWNYEKKLVEACPTISWKRALEQMYYYYYMKGLLTEAKYINAGEKRAKKEVKRSE